MPARRPIACVLLLASLTGADAAAPPERPRLDIYGDALPRHAVARLGTVRLRHPGFARQLAFSPDGKSLASSGDANISEADGSGETDLRFWRVSDGAPLGRVPGLWAVTRARGRLLALRRSGETDFLHDVAAGKDLGRVREVGNPFFRCFSPDGKLGARAGDQVEGGATLLIRDLRTGRLRASFPDRISLCAAFSRDGKSVWSGGLAVEGKQIGGRIRQWDVAGKRLLRDLPAGRGAAYALAISDDGKILAVAHATINFFDDDDEKQTAVTLRDAATGKELHVLSLHGPRTLCLAFSPDGTTVAAGRANMAGLIQLYDTKTGKEIRRSPGTPGTGPSSSAWTSGREIVTLHGKETIRYWDAAGKPGKVIDLSARRPRLVALDPKGTQVAWADQDGRGFALDLRAERETGPIGVRLRGSWLTIRSAGHRFLIGGVGEKKRVWVWDGSRKELRWLTPVDPWNHSWGGAFSPDGSRLALCDYENSFGLYDTATGARTLTFEKPPKPTSTLLFSPDGLTLAASHDNQTITLWDVTSGKRRPVRLYHPSHFVPRKAWRQPNPIAFSPDGKLLATGGVGPETTVRLWDVATGKELTRLAGHALAITSLAFSPDGKRLVSGSEDSTALVWDVAEALAGRGP